MAELMSAKEVSELLRVPERALVSLYRRKRIPGPANVGLAPLWDRDELQAFLDRQAAAQLIGIASVN